MPAPANTSFLTAEDLGTLPADVSLNVHDAGTTYTVYYKFTAAETGIVGAWAFGDVTTYRPILSPWNGPASAPTLINFMAGQNVPIQFPVTAGNEYLLRVLKNGANPSPAVLTLNVQMFVEQAVPVGSLVIPDDVDGFPAAIISATTGDVLKFIHPFPAGEWGDVFNNGSFWVEDNFNQVLKFYGADFVQRGSNLQPFATAESAYPMRISPALNTIYVGAASVSGVAQITTVDDAGAQGATTWSLPTGGLTAIAPNNDGSKVYISGQVSSVNTPVKTWLTASSAFGTDLYAGQGANTKVVDMLVLPDDTVVVAWLNTSTQAVDVRRISSAGALLGTYSTTSTDTPIPKLAYDTTRASHVWLWTHAGSGVTTFHKIAVSTMTATTITGMEFEGGAYQGAETATPTDRFGFSYSCPFFLTRQAPLRPVPPSDPCCCSCEDTGGRNPSSSPLPSAAGPILSPVSTDWTPACTGGGLVPTAADASDAESWVS